MGTIPEEVDHEPGSNGPSKKGGVEDEMAIVFVEPRPKGKPEGSPITDYVVEDRADHILATLKTHDEAVQ